MENVVINDNYNKESDCDVIGEAMYIDHIELVKILLSNQLLNPMRGDMNMNYLLPARFGFFDSLKIIIDNKYTDLSADVIIKWPNFDLEYNKEIKIKLYDAIKRSACEKYNGTDNSEFLSWLESKYNDIIE